MASQNESGILEKARTIYEYKIILLGTVAVGKTSILSRFINDTFINEYKCNIGVQFAAKTIFLDDEKGADLSIWDTCGEERFRAITRQYYKGAAGSLLVFDLTNRVSFESLIYWINDLKSAKDDIEIFVIGNKADVKERQVSFEEANDFIVKQNGLMYFETSAKTGYNIKEMFETLTRKLIEKKGSENYIKNNSEIEKLIQNNSQIIINNSPESKVRNSCCH